MKIYVGNLSFQTNDRTLRDLFEQHGQVEEAVVIMDRETGRSRGFGFVTMPNDGEAQGAIAATNGVEFEGRPLRVNEAQQRQERGGFQRR